jgi:hypothetical protein
MPDEQDVAESPEEAQAVREDPDGERFDGVTEPPEHLAEDPTPRPPEEAPEHIESQ